MRNFVILNDYIGMDHELYLPYQIDEYFYLDSWRNDFTASISTYTSPYCISSTYNHMILKACTRLTTIKGNINADSLFPAHSKIFQYPISKRLKKSSTMFHLLSNCGMVMLRFSLCSSALRCYLLSFHLFLVFPHDHYQSRYNV